MSVCPVRGLSACLRLRDDLVNNDTALATVVLRKVVKVQKLHGMYRCVREGDCYDTICTHFKTSSINITSGYYQANRRQRQRHRRRQERGRRRNERQGS